MHCADTNRRWGVLEETAKVSVKVINDTKFTDLLLFRMKAILEPLAIANNITQATNTHIDHVALTLGNLYQIYNNTDLDEPLRNQILWSLSKRWRAADQDIFILSMLLHPYIRGSCLSKSILHITLFNMANHVFKRLFECEPDLKFMDEFTDFCDRVGKFSDESMGLAMWKSKFEGQVRSINRLELFTFC